MGPTEYNSKGRACRCRRIGPQVRCDASATVSGRVSGVTIPPLDVDS